MLVFWVIYYCSYLIHKYVQIFERICVATTNVMLEYCILDLAFIRKAQSFGNGRLST